MSIQALEGASSPSPTPSEASDVTPSSPPTGQQSRVGVAAGRPAVAVHAGKGGAGGGRKNRSHRKKRQARRRLESGGSAVTDSPKQTAAAPGDVGSEDGTRTISESTNSSSTDSLLDLKLSEAKPVATEVDSADSKRDGRAAQDASNDVVDDTEYDAASDAQDDPLCQAAAPELQEKTEVVAERAASKESQASTPTSTGERASPATSAQASSRRHQQPTHRSVFSIVQGACVVPSTPLSAKLTIFCPLTSMLPVRPSSAPPRPAVPVLSMPALKYTPRCYDMVRDILTTLDIKGAARSLEKTHNLCET